MSGDSVLVAHFATRPEAEMAAELLRSEGIESLVSRDDAGGAYPVLDLVPGVRLRVTPENEARARELLDSHLAADLSDADADADDDEDDADGDDPVEEPAPDRAPEA